MDYVPKHHENFVWKESESLLPAFADEDIELQEWLERYLRWMKSVRLEISFL